MTGEDIIYRKPFVILTPACDRNEAEVGVDLRRTQPSSSNVFVCTLLIDKGNFGYVSRSIPSETKPLEAFVQLIVEYGLTLINIVYVNNEYGLSVVEALTGMNMGRFEVQLLATFGDADDTEGINNVLDALESSPTSVTFLASTVLPQTNFLNMAGSRGMHESHLWLSPTAVQVADRLDPPSTGGIWGVSYGEELTEDNLFAQRYLAKDSAPHVEAMEYGIQDDYNTLTHWGSYGYDAVLTAAHGLAAATNRSDGEEVLKEIRGLTLINTTTGVLQLDENGDRIGARIPVFFITPEGSAEQFAAYYSGTVEFLEDPLWPGGSTVQPTDLIQETVDCKQGSYWLDAQQSCFDCPALENIYSTEEKMSFEGVSNLRIIDSESLAINNEFDKLAPSFVSYSGPIEGFAQNKPAAIEVGNSLSLEFISSSESLAAGIAVGEVVFGITDVGFYPGCIGDDVRVQVEVIVSPETELN
eukprot:scaffold2223_cov46-Cyclotella_meneghiniana.AAC.2